MKRLALLAIAAALSLTLSGCITDSQNTYGESPTSAMPPRSNTARS